MPRITPIAREDITDLDEGFARVEAILGFLPNSNLIMARNKDILRAFQALAAAVLAPGAVDTETKLLVAHVSSWAAGCRYCIAHTGHMSDHKGVPREKLDAVLDYADSPIFSEAERAALGIAWAGSATPNNVTDADFDAARVHWSDDQLVEIVSVLALYGFLNRWNDTVATELEQDPLRFGRERLSDQGWDVGKHG